MAAPSEVRDEPGQPPALTAASLAEQSQPTASSVKEQTVTPFNVSGGLDEHGKPLAIDYDKLVDQFGSQRLDASLLERFEKVTGHRAHRLMRRGTVFSHRDLGIILDRFEKKQPFFLYTGRGPSSGSMHVGHSIPFQFTKYLQDVFQCPLVIMLTDDEKFYHNKELSLSDATNYALENALDIIAVGFDIKKTFIFADRLFIDGGSPAFNDNIRELGKKTTCSQIRGTFGFNETTNIAQTAFPAVQSATSFATSFPFIFGYNKKAVSKIPSLIPCAIDQDAYFRQCRDYAPKLGLAKPSLIHTTFLPSLQGSGTKMSASNVDSSIYLSDTPKQIQKKIGKAFSGGQDTRELHKELGGRTAVDVPYQYLTFFLEDDDELEDIRRKYESGEMETGEIKKRCTEVVQADVKSFQERRKAVTPEIRDEFMRIRPLEFRGMPTEKEQQEMMSGRVEEVRKHLSSVLADSNGEYMREQVLRLLEVVMEAVTEAEKKVKADEGKYDEGEVDEEKAAEGKADAEDGEADEEEANEALAQYLLA